MDPLAGIGEGEALNEILNTPGEADPLGAVFANESEGGLDALAQGVDQATIEAALRATGASTASTATVVDPVAAQALLDIKAMVQNLGDKLVALENKFMAFQESIQEAVPKGIRDLRDMIQAAHSEVMAELATPTEAPPAPAAAPAGDYALNQKILGALLPMLKGRPSFNIGAPAVPAALSAALKKVGIEVTGEQCVEALRASGRVDAAGMVQTS
jgi:hypothetical protein